MGADLDKFSAQLIEEAKGFLSKATDSTTAEAEAANLHAALMLAFCGLEGFINTRSQELSDKSTLSVHEKSVLLEKSVRLVDGTFQMQSTLQMWRPEDRIEFLHVRLGNKLVDKSADWWGQLIEALHLRNELTHAKNIPVITRRAVEKAILGIIGAIDALCRAIYTRKFPLAAFGLQCRKPF